MTKLQVGDVFQGTHAMAYARFFANVPKYIKGETVLQVSTDFTEPFTEMVTDGYDPKTGVPIKVSSNRRAVTSPSRILRRYVVEVAEALGGGMDRFIEVPNGWHITARMLAKDGSYDPKGELIEFYQREYSENQSGGANLSGITAVKHMRKVVNFVEA